MYLSSMNLAHSYHSSLTSLNPPDVRRQKICGYIFITIYRPLKQDKVKAGICAQGSYHLFTFLLKPRWKSKVLSLNDLKNSGRFSLVASYQLYCTQYFQFSNSICCCSLPSFFNELTLANASDSKIVAPWATHEKYYILKIKPLN